MLKKKFLKKKNNCKVVDLILILCEESQFLKKRILYFYSFIIQKTVTLNYSESAFVHSMSYLLLFNN